MSVTPHNVDIPDAGIRLLGELLVEAGHIDARDLDKALDIQARIGGRLGAILVRTGALSEDVLLEILSRQLGLDILQADAFPSDTTGYRLLGERAGIGRDWWLDQEILAWEQPDGTIHCVARDPLEDTVHELFASVFPGETIHWHLARNQDLDHALEQFAHSEPEEGYIHSDDIAHLRELAEEAPVVELVNNLLSQAIDQRASDVHIEPEESSFFVRYRVDGILHTHLKLPRERYDAVASRIKLISGIDIAERRLPQDGRLGTRVSGQELDIRVSTVPGVHGESIVMRLLPKGGLHFNLNHLGLEQDHLERFSRWANEPHGIVLVTGPTGSGKSTTLYATLEAINNRTLKIITVEDPVEYQLKGITQIQAHSDIGYTFARALRSILRQDPDVIMIGEIRDLETAEIAMQAALTGHLVFSTVHTNDAVSAFTRLIDIGVEPFLVSSSVHGVQAQRLVRRLCTGCAEEFTPPDDIISATQAILPAHLQDTAARWLHPKGCAQCQDTGYRGRLGIYEMVEVSPDIQKLILSRAPAGAIQAAAAAQGSRTLRDDGLLKAYQGLTSVEEVLRVTGS